MGDVLNLHPKPKDALKVLIRQILNGEIALAESIGFIIQSAKQQINSGQTTWEELGTTEEELLAKKSEAPK